MVQNELFTNENRTTENVSENASENNGRDEEPDDGASQVLIDNIYVTRSKIVHTYNMSIIKSNSS